MAVIGEAFIDVKPKTDQFGNETEKGVSSGLGKVAKGAAVVFGAALAVGAAGHFVAGFVKAAAESEKISRVTDAIIKSTGGAAGISAVQVGDLATSLSNLTAVDDELIQSAENVLLTFTNVGNGVGEGANIFDRATAAALDMSTVLGGDASSAAVQLGKALNDPIKGIAALSKAGVTFTEEQKAQIKTLQEAGDLIGAQKIVLGELEREFKGAAEAAADPFARLTVTMGNLKETIGSALIPILAPAATALSNLVSENQVGITGALESAIDGVVGVFRFLEPGARNVAAALVAVYDAVVPLVAGLVDFLDNHAPKLGGFFEENTPLAETLSTAIVGLATAFAGLAIATPIVAGLAPLAGILASIAKGAVLLGVALAGVVSGPVLLAAAAVVAIAAAATFAYIKFQPFRDIVDNVASFFVDLGNNALPVLQAIGGALAGFGRVIASVDLSGIGGAFESAGAGLSRAADVAGTAGAVISRGLGAAADAITGALAPAISFVAGLWEQYGDEVTGIVVGLADIIGVTVGLVVETLQLLVDRLAIVAEVIGGVLGPAFDVLAVAVELAIGTLTTVVQVGLTIIQTAFEAFIGVVGPAWTVLWGLIQDIVANVVGPISAIIEGLLAVIQGVVDVVAGIFTGDWKRIWDGFTEIINGAIGVVQGILETFLGFLAAVWSNATALLLLPIETAWATIQTVVGGAVTVVQQLLQGAIDFLQTTWSNAGTLLTAPVDAAKAVISGAIDLIVSFFSGLPGRVTSALVSFAATLFGIASSALADMSRAVTTGIGNVIDSIAGLPGKAVAAIGDLGRILFDKGVEIVQGFIDGVRSMASAAASAVAGVIPGVFGFGGGLDQDKINVGKGASGGVIPTPLGQPYPLIAHGQEVLLNPRQQAQLLWSLANVPIGSKNRAMGGDAFTVEANFINQGTIIGVDDLEAMMAAHTDSVVDAVAGVVQGRRLAGRV